MAGLVGFVVSIIALLAAGAIFFVSIDKVAPDAFVAKIAKIAVGALLIIALVFAVAGAFGVSVGVTISPVGVLYFAIAVIVAVAVLYIINLALDWIAKQMATEPGSTNPAWVGPVKYILGIIVLVGLLVAAADLLFGVRAMPFRAGALELPGRADSAAPATYL